MAGGLQLSGGYLGLAWFTVYCQRGLFSRGFLFGIYGISLFLG